MLAMALPLTRDDTLDTGSGASARSVTEVNVQTGATAATKDVTGDTRRGARREELEIRPDSRVGAAAATTDSVTDARREWAATTGAPSNCCVCYEALTAPMVLLGSCPHRFHLPRYAVPRVRATTELRCPACRATVPVEEADRRALQQHREEVVKEAIVVAR